MTMKKQASYIPQFGQHLSQKAIALIEKTQNAKFDNSEVGKQLTQLIKPLATFFEAHAISKKLRKLWKEYSIPPGVIPPKSDPNYQNAIDIQIEISEFQENWDKWQRASNRADKKLEALDYEEVLKAWEAAGFSSDEADDIMFAQTIKYGKVGRSAATGATLEKISQAYGLIREVATNIVEDPSWPEGPEADNITDKLLALADQIEQIDEQLQNIAVKQSSSSLNEVAAQLLDRGEPKLARKVLGQIL